MTTRLTLLFTQLNEQQTLHAIEEMANDSGLEIETMDNMIYDPHTNLSYKPDHSYFFEILSEVRVSVIPKQQWQKENSYERAK